MGHFDAINFFLISTDVSARDSYIVSRTVNPLDISSKAFG
jgi:hypothetical protein